MNTKILMCVLCTSAFIGACTHTIEYEPSDKPIIIELNVNINQEIRVRLDEDVEDLIADNPDLF